MNRRNFLFFYSVCLFLGMLVLLPASFTVSLAIAPSVTPGPIGRATYGPRPTLPCTRCPTPTLVKAVANPTKVAIPKRTRTPTSASAPPSGPTRTPRPGRPTRTPRPNRTPRVRPTRTPAAGTPNEDSCVSNAFIVMQRDDPVSGNSDIVSFDLRTKADFVLTAGFPGQNTHPSVAPDGCLVVFAHADNTTDNADLYTISITGGTPDQVTDTPEISEVQPVWSPLDSIVYAVPDGDLFVTDEFGDVNVDLGVEGDSPQTSPDGQWVLFTLTDTPTDQIAVVSILGRAHGFYDLEVQGDHPHWSANGQAIFIQAGGGIVGFEFGKPPTLIKAGATDISVNPGGNGAVLVVDGQLWLFRTLDQSDSPQQLTQPGGHKLTNSAPEWWNPNPATADMRPFLHYLQGVAPVS